MHEAHTAMNCKIILNNPIESKRHLTKDEATQQDQNNEQETPQLYDARNLPFTLHRVMTLPK